MMRFCVRGVRIILLADTREPFIMYLSAFFSRLMPGLLQRERAVTVANCLGLKAGTVQKYFQLDRYPAPKALEKFTKAYPGLDVSAWRKEYLAAKENKQAAGCERRSA